METQTRENPQLVAHSPLTTDRPTNTNNNNNDINNNNNINNTTTQSFGHVINFKGHDLGLISVFGSRLEVKVIGLFSVVGWLAGVAWVVGTLRDEGWSDVAKGGLGDGTAGPPPRQSAAARCWTKRKRRRGGGGGGGDGATGGQEQRLRHLYFACVFVALAAAAGGDGGGGAWLSQLVSSGWTSEAQLWRFPRAGVEGRRVLGRRCRSGGRCCVTWSSCWGLWRMRTRIREMKKWRRQW